MFFKRIIPYVLSFVFLGASIVYVSETDKEQQPKENKPVMNTAVEKPTEEIRGVWVTYMTLDVEGEADPQAAFQEKIDAIIADMERAHLNTMIVQTRPFCDARSRSTAALR